MEKDRKEPVQEKEDCQPLTDEEFKAYQEKDKRTIMIQGPILYR